MRVNSLDTPLLDFWVAKSLGLQPVTDGRGAGTISVMSSQTGKLEPFQPSLNWAQAAPVMASCWHDLESVLIDWLGPLWSYVDVFQKRPQVWFMRAFVALHFGDEVEELDEQA